jgi:membrane protease YdiL (CAAX protease family)
VHLWSAMAIAAWMWSLTPILALGFGGDRIIQACQTFPLAVRLILPAVFGVPYAFAGSASGRGNWLVLYFTLPILVAVLLWRASQYDPQQRGDWRDFAILLILGLTVDLRWLESAWPAQLRAVNKLILLDAGLYGFLVIRKLTNVGFDLRIRGHDARIGLREVLFYAPIAVPLGLALGFLHWHAHVPKPGPAAAIAIFTFLFIAVPEEIYFRGWMQNLLERRFGSHFSLWLTAAIFGLSHFNKGATHFNWRYVLLAALAGIFYGRAWRCRHRVVASAITHTCVDTVWSIWLR